MLILNYTFMYLTLAYKIEVGMELNKRVIEGHMEHIRKLQKRYRGRDLEPHEQEVMKILGNLELGIWIRVYGYTEVEAVNVHYNTALEQVPGDVTREDIERERAVVVELLALVKRYDRQHSRWRFVRELLLWYSQVFSVRAALMEDIFEGDVEKEPLPGTDVLEDGLRGIDPDKEGG